MKFSEVLLEKAGHHPYTEHSLEESANNSPGKKFFHVQPAKSDPINWRTNKHNLLF